MRRVVRAIALAAGGAAALAALAAWSRREVRRAEEIFPPWGRSVELSGGARLHVVEEGAAGPDLVVIHGADGVSLSFTETVSSQLARDHRVFTVDRPGHGWSTLPQGAVPDVATNVALIREGVGRLGVRRPIVLGHSYGGLTALAWALEHPGEVRALVLLAPVAAFPWRVPAGVFRLANVPVVGRVLTDALVVPLGRPVIGALARNAFSPHDVPDAYAAYARALYLRPAQFRALMAECANLRADVARLAPRFPELDLPVEIVAAEHDRVTRVADHVRTLAQAVPGANLVELAGAGHEFMWDRPEAIVDAVRRAERQQHDATGLAEPVRR